MTRVTMLGRLTAAEDRTLKGVLLPFGVPGLTNLGKVTAAKGTLTIPADVTALHASLDHLDDRDPVAAFKVVKETDDGLYAEWDVPKTHGGDRLLAEYRAGVRTGVSVELEPVHIKDGAITAGTVIGCAFPVEPAFDTARLVAEKAEAPDVDDDTQLCDVDGCTDTDPDHTHDDPEAPAEGDDADAGDNPEGAPMKPPAKAPADLLTAARRNPSGLTTKSITKPGDFFRLMAEAHRTRDKRLMAALSDIVPADTADSEVPQWLGELWSGIPYQRRIIPLLAQAELTGLKAKGWRWVTKPQVARYAGNKANVPSNTVEMEAVDKEAQRFAGAHDIDRKYRDFNDTAFFESYYRAMGESYSTQTDDYALEELKAEATPLAFGSPVAGVPNGWTAIVRGALSMVRIGAPSYAVVEASVWEEMVLTGTDKFFEFLNASLSFSEGQLNGGNFRIIPVDNSAVGDASGLGLDAGEVLVGAKQAATWHELGGGAPIRVEAIDMVRGGVDAGVFGYGELIVHDPRALVLVDTNPDGA